MLSFSNSNKQVRDKQINNIIYEMEEIKRDIKRYQNEGNKAQARKEQNKLKKIKKQLREVKKYN